ncbi:zinc finger protein Pegasus-like [Physella acuta]|uniref:zinc finger protein Pegasus-like n=1 Tax=Physella acuta TaxID=109671 RepID=UPI0027DB9A9E|nr:zinc finger protein Pegasus-like [Physella acuta]XP_059179022.1 zinc finger protein Pegasus-like [Physella acuta]
MENQVSANDLRGPDIPSMVCDFKQEMDLNEKFEEPNKMYVCHLCDFRTAFRNSLLNHQAVHSDYRPWVCAMCDYAAKRKQDLKKHLHTIHGVMVESTMLRPVGTAPNSTTSVAPRSLSREESSEDNSWDNEKINKTPGNDSFSGSASQTHPENLKNPTASGKYETTVPVKKEVIENKSSNSPYHSALPSMSNFVNHTSRESPDMDLPVSFSSASDIKFPSSQTPYTQADIHEHILFPSEKEYLFSPDRLRLHKPTAIRDFAEKYLSSSESTSSGTPIPNQKQLRKRPYSTLLEPQDSTPSNKNHDTDDAHPCSSSTANSSFAKGNQTQQTFLCEHCDIMFFQRAMYLMHVGLHSPDNPWCCAVCGGMFTEKYSFTSHFINQH